MRQQSPVSRTFIIPLPWPRIAAEEDWTWERLAIVSALLHDVVEDTDTTLDYNISVEEFGEKVANIID